MVNYSLLKNIILLFDGIPEMFVLCDIYYFRNPVRLVLVLAGIIESWTASLGIFGLINVANVW